MFSVHVGTGHQSSRETLTLGLGQQSDGTAESELRLLDHVIENVNQALAAAYPAREPYATAQISGHVSDHQPTELAVTRQMNAKRLQDDPSLAAISHLFCWNHK